jgi:DNA (cytosine-5)-methyltransferase 3A
MKKLKVLSLFDGISVAQQALKELGYDVEYYASEIDKYAISITQKNHPNTIQLGSVTDVCHLGFNINKDIDYNVDLLIGGSPCQDLSIAKKNRKGLDGERSGLFWEYVRILKEVKPKYFVLENVNSMPKEAKAIITEALGVEPIMINASLVSAQNRKRLFWTNIPNIILPEDRNILLRDVLEPKVDDCYTVKPKSNTVRTSGRGSGVDDKHNWDTIRIGQIGKGGQGDRIYSPEGKSVGLSALGGGRGAKTGLYAIVPEATKKGYAIAQDGDSIDLSFPKSKTRRGRVGNKVKNLMTSQNIGVFTNSVIRKLTPIECERLQSLPDNYTGGYQTHNVTNV